MKKKHTHTISWLLCCELDLWFPVPVVNKNQLDQSLHFKFEDVVITSVDESLPHSDLRPHRGSSESQSHLHAITIILSKQGRHR